MQNEPQFIVYRAQRSNVNIMLYTYVLKIACVSRLKTKVESQGFIRCRHHGYVLNHVLYFIKTFFVVIKKNVCIVCCSKYNGRQRLFIELRCCCYKKVVQDVG